MSGGGLNVNNKNDQQFSICTYPIQKLKQFMVFSNVWSLEEFYSILALKVFEGAGEIVEMFFMVEGDFIKYFLS